MANQTRRKLLKTTGAITGISAIAGCTGGSDDEDHGEPVPEMEMLLPAFLSFDDHGRQISQQWENALGIDIEIEIIDWDTYLGNVFGAPFEYPEMCLWTWAGTPERLDPEFMLSVLASDSTQNTPHYENEEYDELFDDLTQAFEQDEQNEIIAEMQEIIMRDVPVVEYFRSPTANPVNTSRWDIPNTDFIGVGAPSVHSHTLAEPQTPDAESLRIGWNGRYNQPNPMNVLSAPIWAFMGHAYDSLRRIGLDGTLTNWAVEEFDQIDDQTIDLTLREGMEFHDGEPVTASDLAFTLNMHSNYSFPKYTVYGQRIEQASAETDLTARLEFTEPYAPFLTGGAISFKIVPEHIWQEVVESDDPVNFRLPDEDAIGSGPFEIVELTDEELVFEANEDHWSAPDYDEIRIVSQDSLEGMRANIVGGELDLMAQAPAVEVVEQTADGSDDIEIISGPGLQWTMIVLDNEVMPTADRPFRRALQRAIDPDFIKDVFYNDFGDIANGAFIHPEMDFGDEYPPISQDVEEARGILSDAGYTWDGDDNLRYPEEYDI